MDKKHLIEKAVEYIRLFENKDINGLSKMFAGNVSLHDWENEFIGFDNVIDANKKIFTSVSSIKVITKNLYQQDQTVVSEMKILFNEKDELLVVDIINFNESGEIESIRAYKG